MVEVSVWVPIACATVVLVVQAVAMITVARSNMTTKREEVAGDHRSKLMELAVKTANSEFSSSQDILEKAGIKPRPMSLYIIFHFLLFKKLENMEEGESPDVILREVFREIRGTYKVYAQSGIKEFGLVWNIDEPRPTRRAPTRDPGSGSQ